MWEAVDPEGRIVVLDLEGWQHIVTRHSELHVDPQDILAAVAEPDGRASGPRAGEEWFYREGVGPSRWLKVVVHSGNDRGLIVTAFPRRSYP